VLELSSRGLRQMEIVAEFSKMGIDICQKTISNDLAWIARDSIEFVHRNRQHLALEYRKVKCNYELLRKEAWKHYYSTNDEKVKVELYGIIDSINQSITDVQAAGDILDKELEAAEEKAESVKEKMSKVVGEEEEQYDDQAVF
jgi:hypothetical protein